MSMVNCLPQTVGIGATTSTCNSAELPEKPVDSKDVKPDVPLCTRFEPLRNIDEDENEDEEDNEEGSNTSTLLMKDRWANKVFERRSKLYC